MPGDTIALRHIYTTNRHGTMAQLYVFKFIYNKNTRNVQRHTGAKDMNGPEKRR